jgi:hypothetical protein
MRNSTGVTGAAPIWHDIMETVFADPAYMREFYPAGEPPLEFEPPAGVVKTRACVPTGKGSCRTVEDWWLEDRVPGRNGTEWMTGVKFKTYQVLNLDAEGTEYCLPAREQGVPEGLLEALDVPLVGSDTSADIRAFIELVGKYSTLVERDDANPDSLGESSAVPPTCTDQQVAKVLTERSAEAEAAGGDGGAGQVAGLSYYISSPVPGQHVSGVIPIFGSALFGPDFMYYKIEIAGPDGNWLTIGAVHSENVANGTLEVLHADALPPGQYQLRLLVVRQDSNYPLPYVVPITIGAVGP